MFSYPFKFIRQPSVIAEVIGGILMGPTALSRWPWFRTNIFPTESLSALNVLANLGLLLFLLLMGLELDLLVVAKRARISLAISLTGIASTFALSLGVSRYFYDLFPDLSNGVAYPKILLFIGVAMSVTAFPVLARILTERKLLRTPVGISVISAAAVDDAVGWMALALVIALIQATSPITGLYIFLTVFAFTAFMFLLIRPLLAKLHRRLLALRNASHEEVSLSRPMVLVAFLLTFTASFFTSAVGIHAIFGAFITGLVLPREDGFAVRLTEKLEELVTIVLLPLYFTFSGLRTNVGAVNSGVSVGGLVVVVGAACLGKIGGCAGAARCCGLNLRESMAVGVLMNTKGLVEIIILNIGLDAGLINDQVFAIMVLLAILTTCMTTPLISLVYPSSYYSLVAKESFLGDNLTSFIDRFIAEEPKKLLLCLPNSSFVATMMGFLHKISQGRPKVDVEQIQQETAPPASVAVTAAAALSKAVATIASSLPTIHVVRLRHMTDRMSTLIRAASEIDDASWTKDPSLTVLRTFGLLCGIEVTPHVLFSHSRDYAKEVARVADETDCDTIVVPWRLFKTAAVTSDRHHVGHFASTLSEDTMTHIGASSPHPKSGDLKMLFGVAHSERASVASTPFPMGASIASNGEERGLRGGESEHHGLGSDAAAPVYEFERWIGEFASHLLRKARVKVAVLVDRSSEANIGGGCDLNDREVVDIASSATQEEQELPPSTSSTHFTPPPTKQTQPKKLTSIVVPFFGGPDDRAALQLAIRCSSSPDAVVSVIHIRRLHPIADAKATSVSSTAEAIKDNRQASVGVLRPRRMGKGVAGTSQRNSMQDDQIGRGEEGPEFVPPGYAVDPIDAEDAKLLGLAIGTDLALADVASTAFEDVDLISPTATVGTAIARTLTAPSTTLPTHHPRVSVTQVTSKNPISTCLNLLRKKPCIASITTVPPTTSLVIVGHFGPTWSGLVVGSGQGHHDEHLGTAWNRWSLANYGSWHAEGRERGGEGGVEERVLGPTGLAIVREGVGEWSLMVVRKVRVGGKVG
ncbi:K(+)/H(+) antiporter [Dinochytrium kinnereticum]|nr:K(+)/H(+) antiporter [Dinochytrium kinnereticum]